MWNDFKKFAVKGSVIDLAVGVIIGAAFGKIVTSLVEDILMPVIGLLMGGVDFSKLAIGHGQEKLKYGEFIQTIADFFIISFSIFLFVRLIQHFRRKEEEKAAVIPDRTEELLIEIRDLLKEQRQSQEKI